jgi:sulfate adenylyltransferase subunit 1
MPVRHGLTKKNAMTETINSVAASANPSSASGQFDAHNSSALRFITCGSVDDGKSTLIGRLLVDTRAVLQDQLAASPSPARRIWPC